MNKNQDESPTIFSQEQANAIKKAAYILRALNHKLRKQMLHLIKEHGKITVTELYKLLKIEQSVASQHLAILRKEKIVLTERKSKRIFYSVNQQEIDRINSIVRNLVNGSGS